MASYDVSDYLLDRANIHDTVNKLVWYYDHFSRDGFEEVFAEEIEVDYRAFTDNEPKTWTRADFVDELKRLVASFASSQHVVSGIIANLPQPGHGRGRPVRCETTAKANGHLVREGQETVHNGGHYHFELVRVKELQEAGLNPWRISKMLATKAWSS